MTFNPHTAANLATALETTGPHSYYPTDEECRLAAEQLRAAIGEVERLRGAVLRPLTEAEVVAALHEGAAESRAAQGDNAWSSLLSQRDSALAAAARLTEENGRLRSNVKTAAGLGGHVANQYMELDDSHASLAARLAEVEAERERMRGVYEAAVEWRESKRGDSWLVGTDTELARAIDRANMCPQSTIGGHACTNYRPENRCADCPLRSATPPENKP